LTKDRLNQLACFGGRLETEVLSQMCAQSFEFSERAAAATKSCKTTHHETRCTFVAAVEGDQFETEAQGLGKFALSDRFVGKALEDGGVHGSAADPYWFNPVPFFAAQ
jgi:hypothetical protein